MYRVVVKDGDCGYCNELVFDFQDQEHALEFCSDILNISDYNIEIINLKEE